MLKSTVASVVRRKFGTRFEEEYPYKDRNTGAVFACVGGGSEREGQFVRRGGACH